MEDIIDIIPSLREVDPNDVSARVREFIEIGDDWLNI